MEKNKIKLLAEISIFSAIIVILQLLATFINFGSFPITLTLIPIIVGSFVYGPLVGGLLGLVFGIVVKSSMQSPEIIFNHFNESKMFATKNITQTSPCDATLSYKLGAKI